MKPDTGHRAAPGPEGGFSFLSLEKALLGELDPQERARLEARLAADPETAAVWREAAGLRSRLTWQELRARLPDSGVRSTGSRPRRGIRLETLLPRIPRPILGLAAALALVLLCLPFSARYLAGGSGAGPDEAEAVNGLRSKGKPIPEVVLEADGARVPSDRRFPVKPGAILTFAYRSPHPLFVQIWYTEDGSEPRRFDGRKVDNLFWSEHGDWSHAPQRVALDGSWKVQRVFIVASPAALGEAEAADWIAGRARPGPGVRLFAYTLEQP